MDASTRRLLNSILGYLDSAPPNVKNDLLNDLKRISDDIMQTSLDNSPITPGQRAVAQAMGGKEPVQEEYDPNDVEKSPGQREAEAVAADQV